MLCEELLSSIAEGFDFPAGAVLFVAQACRFSVLRFAAADGEDETKRQDETHGRSLDADDCRQQRGTVKEKPATPERMKNLQFRDYPHGRKISNFPENRKRLHPRSRGRFASCFHPLSSLLGSCSALRAYV